MKRLFLLIAFTIAAYIVVLTCIVSCANMGSGPDGGPYDETPPRIVGMTSPSQVASGSATKSKKKHKSTKFHLLFSELVTIDNPSENVIVSPPQIEMPNIQAVGKKITVELLDSLKPNTTYTVDFSDAIKDNNEGNPLGHYTYIFSTGEVTDTMQMSGYVLNAEDLEPLSGILVGLHPSADGLEETWLVDTLFTTTPFDRVARTDGAGYFSIKGVKDGAKYHIYALKDSDGDFAFSQKSEQIAFMPQTLTPAAFPDTRYDTLWIDSTRYDSIRIIPYTHFTPDDVVLLAFQEANQPRFRLKDERSDLNNFKIWFTAGSKHVPTIHGINFNDSNAFVEQRNATNDTLVYWLRDSLLMKQDTLSFVYEFEAWDDSLQQHLLKTDTLELVSRTPWEKRQEAKRKELEKWQKQLEKRHKRGDYSQEEPPIEHIKVNCNANGSLAPNQNVLFTFDQPIADIDSSGIHLLLMVDSIGTEADYLFEDVDNNILARRLVAEWRPEQKYSLVVDSGAIHNIYGLSNEKLKKDFSIETLEKFGTYFVTLSHLPDLSYVPKDSTDTIPVPDATVIVQLLDKSGKTSYSINAVSLGNTSVRGEFYYLKEGEYHLRCIVDRNGNGKWDPGAWADRLAPEEVFYFDKTVAVRAGWDLNEDWDITAIPLHKQKPEALIKQKKKDNNRSNAHERNIKRLEDRANGGANKNNSGSKSMTKGFGF